MRRRCLMSWIRHALLWVINIARCIVWQRENLHGHHEGIELGLQGMLSDHAALATALATTSISAATLATISLSTTGR